MKNSKEIENRKTEYTEEKSEEIHRITVSKAAEEALTKLVGRVNEGFEGGRINRTQVANWVILKSQESFGDIEIKDIRAEHLDEFVFLEALMRKAKKTGQLPAELRSFMNKQLDLDDAPKKRKKGLQRNHINDVFQRNESADITV